METLSLLLYAALGIIAVLLLVNLIILSGYSAVNSVLPPFKDGESSVTFIGHGTALVHIDGTNILTDPNFNDWIIIFHRIKAPGLKIESLPKIDAILLSHVHRDHLDAWTMKQFPRDTPVLISKGNGDILRDWGFTDVREMDAWNSTTIKSAKITATPAKHSGARNSVFADYPHALSYVIKGTKTVYFAGDTGLFDKLNEIGSKYKVDVALLPIGAYRPRQFLKSRHMNAEDALEAMKMLGAKEMIPIHWGSFQMALDGVNEPKELLETLANDAGLEERIHILGNGEKYIIR